MRFMKKLFFIFFICLLAGCSNATDSSQKEQEKTNVEAVESWSVSESHVIENGGQLHRLIGTLDKIAITNSGFEVGKEEVHTWYLWNKDKQKLIGETLKIIGTNQENLRKVEIGEGKIEDLNSDEQQWINEGFVKGIKASMPIKLESKGLWKLDAYVEGKLMGSVIIKAIEK